MPKIIFIKVICNTHNQDAYMIGKRMLTNAFLNTCQFQEITSAEKSVRKNNAIGLQNTLYLHVVNLDQRQVPYYTSLYESYFYRSAH